MSSPVEVAIAVLRSRTGEAYLMQLRDDLPTIAWPGCWAFFGGHLEPGETPQEAIRRELAEEIAHTPASLVLYRSYSSATSLRHVFQGQLTVDSSQLQLNEGLDMGLFTREELRSGELFSARLGQTRKIAQPHLEILGEILEL